MNCQSNSHASSPFCYIQRSIIIMRYGIVDGMDQLVYIYLRPIDKSIEIVTIEERCIDWICELDLHGLRHIYYPIKRGLLL